MERNELISYAMDFASYLILKYGEIRRVILYGSVARGDFKEDSDVDLFIDVGGIDEKKAKKKVDMLLDDYYKTRKFKEWQMKGIENEFSIIIGNLDSKEWNDLRRAILNEGIVLYGKFIGRAEKMKQYALFSFENIKPDKKRVSVFRALFGFKVRKMEYIGLIKKIGGVRIGKGSVLVPVSGVSELRKYLHEKKVSVKIYDVWSDERF